MASHVLDWGDAPPDECRGGGVAVGNFDGAHRGHAALIAPLARGPRPAVVVTFDPHPLALLRPGSAPPLLTTPEDRAALLQRLGADHVITLRTTPELLRLSAAAFFGGLMVEKLAARAAAEGPNFRFGKDREGDVGLLGELCRRHGMTLDVVELERADGTEVSSSLIRAALLDGRLAEANAALGRRYAITGVVEAGERRGRRLGFPTANLGDVRTVVPGEGVYAARALGRPAAVNVGPNPTFGGHVPKIEAHLIGFDGDLYGRPLTLEFVSRLRDTRRFGSVEELRAQLARDVARAAEEAGDE
ncbi:MAG: riboflavin biosynthesis protein RibF [Gemmataceae bacterium]